MKGILLTAVTAIGAVLLPGSAAAQWNGDQQTIVVNVSSLDLSTGAGIDLMVYRLRSAIDRMCDDDRDCRDEAWESADWQAARAISRDRWRKRVAMERQADWARYGPPRRGFAPPPPRQAFAPPPPPRLPYPADILRVTKVTDITTTVTKRTRFIIEYRNTPPGDRWRPN
jgi:UrcA family protein